MTGLNACQWQDAIVDQICEKLFVAMGSGNVREAFTHFDVDGDGNIAYEEFINALKALDIGLSDDQAKAKDGGAGSSSVSPGRLVCRYRLAVSYVVGLLRATLETCR